MKVPRRSRCPLIVRAKHRACSAGEGMTTLELLIPISLFSMFMSVLRSAP